MQSWGLNAAGQIGDGTQSPYFSASAQTILFDVPTVGCSAVAGTPTTEVCGNSIDEDCDGVLNNGC